MLESKFNLRISLHSPEPKLGACVFIPSLRFAEHDVCTVVILVLQTQAVRLRNCRNRKQCTTRCAINTNAHIYIKNAHSVCRYDAEGMSMSEADFKSVMGFRWLYDKAAKWVRLGDGIACCAERMIAFHYIKPEMMRGIHRAVFECRRG